MAEAVVGVVVEQLVSATTEWLMEEISLIKGVEPELDNMSSKMKLIQKVLDDAENKSIKDPTLQTEEWLEKVQDVSYEMEDVLDAWSTIVNKQKYEEAQNYSSSYQISSSSTMSSSSSKFACMSLKQFDCFKSIKQVGWRRDIASRIKIINGKVDTIFNQMDQFKLIQSEVRSVVLDRVTTSFVTESLVHGRDVEKEALLNKLCESDEQGDHTDVVSIVGLGGLGKTTLAQLAYNDERVIKHFVKRIWVCVSNTFDEVKVAKAILEGLEVSHIGKDELQTLHGLIQSSLSNDKFLLVLDDVWTGELEKWERLRACLGTGTQGCRVLITTRSDTVATIMNTSEANMLRPQLISIHDCWMLMSQVAFQKKRKDDVHKFENIGREIAKKCKGLPLAAKTLGGLLILKDTIEEWKEVLKSEIWELEKAETQLFPHLFLSYTVLPATLKRCFILYSIFPKDYKISVDKLISLWIGHGYINPAKQIHDLEHVGQEYFRYLVSRSFFEVEVAEFNSLSYASMHDIMHDFALHLSRNNFLTITRDDNNPEPTSSVKHKFKKAHHLFIDGTDPSTFCDVGRLRTCLAKRVPRDVRLGMFRHLKLVRTLSLTRCDLDQIPQEIGKFIHLRILDLSYNFSLRELPETIGDLYNLKYLLLERCDLQKFPQSIGKLVNLRILTVESERWKLLAPESLGKLVNLQNLRRVHVAARSLGLGFLKNLNQLNEDLLIVFESDYIDDIDANEANLKRKKEIKKFTFDFNEKDVAEAVIEALEPPTEAKVVGIINFRGTKLPSWINSLNNVTELEISLSENIVSLPPLGKLPYLVKLRIHKLSALKFIGRDFLGIENNTRESIENASSSSSIIAAFPALEELELSSLYDLEKWEDLKVEEEYMTNVMPQLQFLTIESCPKLQVMPLRVLRKASPFLKRLTVYEIELPSNLRFTGEEVTEGIVGPLLPPFPNLQYLDITNHMGPRLSSWIGCLNYLTKLKLFGAAEVQSLPPLGKLPFLEDLSVTIFSSLKFIGREFLGIDIASTSTAAAATASSPSSIAYFPKLVSLSLNSLDALIEWEDIRVEEEKDTSVQVMPNLKNLNIARCPSLVVLPQRLFHKALFLQSLNITDDERRPQYSSWFSFEAVFGTMVLAIPKFKHFTICDLMDPKLPSWITSLNYLTDLNLSHSKNVTSLPPLGKLSCLQVLFISSLSVLKSVGREFLGIEDDSNRKSVITTSMTSFPKLKTLVIAFCEELEVWEDIKPEEYEDGAIPLMPNLSSLHIRACPKLEVLPHRLLRRASSPLMMELRIAGCGITRDKIVEDTELLLRLKIINLNEEILERKSER